MKTTLQVCILFLLLWVPIYLFYWHVFRPVILTKIRYAIFECRDRIRLLAIKKNLGNHPAVFEVLEPRCNVGLKIVDQVNLIHFIRAREDKLVFLKSKSDLDIVSESPKEIREISDELNSALVAGIAINSPFLGALGLVLVVFLICLFPLLKSARNFWAAFRQCAWGATYVANAPA